MAKAVVVSHQYCRWQNCQGERAQKAPWVQPVRLKRIKKRMVADSSIPGPRTKIILRLIVTVFALEATSARCEVLLPFQDISGFFTTNICRDPYVLLIIASTIDAVLPTTSVVRK